MMSEPEIDFLSEVETETPAPEVVEQPVTETVETPETPAPVVPTTPEPKEETVPLAALRAEREKRQKYERELAEYRQRQQPLPDFNQAPDQYVAAVVSQHTQGLQQQFLGALEEQARTTYPDYDEVFEVLEGHAAQNPALIAQVMQSPNPALAAYRLGKQLRELEAMKDPDAYRKQIEAEIRQQIAAEEKAKADARQKAANAIPPNLADARASKDDEVLPDDSLDSILKSKR
jgi:hypothetical protein